MRRLAAFAAVALLAAGSLSGCLAVGPAGPYKNGQLVDLSITQFDPGDTVWLSECAPGQVPSTVTGCLPSRTGQPSVRLDSRGSGSAHFRVASRVANTTCAGYCTIVATNGKRLQSTAISFVAKGRVDVAAGFDAEQVSIYVNGKFFYANQGAHGLPPFEAAPGTYRFDFYAGGRPPAIKPIVSTSVVVRSGQATSLVAFRTSVSAFRLVQTQEPPPAPAGRLRVTIVNALPVTVTAKLDSGTSQGVGAGRAATLLVTPPSNIPNGDDSFELTYPPHPSGGSPCGVGNAGGIFYRGHGYVLTAIYAREASATCPYIIGPIVHGGIDF
jgi:hypothetical protein